MVSSCPAHQLVRVCRGYECAVSKTSTVWPVTPCRLSSLNELRSLDSLLIIIHIYIYIICMHNNEDNVEDDDDDRGESLFHSGVVKWLTRSLAFGQTQSQSWSGEVQLHCGGVDLLCRVLTSSAAVVTGVVASETGW